MQLKPIPKMVSYKERVYAELKQAIMRGQLKSGDMLNERALALKLGISRMPVREALQRLETEGWLEREPCRGTWVRKVTLEDVTELYQMRRGLETLAVELVLRALTTKEREKMERMAQRLESMPCEMEYETFVQMDSEFHLYLAKLSGNRLLHQSMCALMERMTMYVIQTYIRKSDPYEVPTREHAGILRTILADDASAAKRAVEKHIERAYGAAVKNLAV